MYCIMMIFKKKQETIIGIGAITYFCLTLLTAKPKCFNMVLLHSKLFGASSKYARSTFLATTAPGW